jgi:hypothetical protein
VVISHHGIHLFDIPEVNTGSERLTSENALPIFGESDNIHFSPLEATSDVGFRLVGDGLTVLLRASVSELKRKLTTLLAPNRLR